MAIPADELEEIIRTLEEVKEDREYSERSGCCKVHPKKELVPAGIVFNGIEELYACPVKGCGYQVVLRASEKAQEKYNRDMRKHFTI